jgi:hypothetical protein
VDPPFKKCPYCGYALAFELVDMKIDRDVYPRVLRISRDNMVHVDIVRLTITAQVPHEQYRELADGKEPNTLAGMARFLLPFSNGDRIVKDIDTGKYVRHTPRIRAGMDPLYINRSDIYTYTVPSDPYMVKICAHYTALTCLHPLDEEVVAHAARSLPLEIYHDHIEIARPNDTIESVTLLARAFRQTLF